jgi:hypothetical protein
MNKFSGNRAAWLLLAMAPLLLLAAGCGSNSYRVHVEAYSYASPEAKRFVILPGVMDVKPDNTDYQAVTSQLARLMTSKGYVQAPDLGEADLALYVAYDKQKTVQGPHRVWHGIEITPPENWVLTVEAVDLVKYKANDSKYMQWRMKTVCYEADPSIVKAMPYIMAAMSDYVGRGGDVNLEVDENLNVKVAKAKGHHHLEP